VIASVGISFKICFKEIGEKENLQDSKHDKKLDKNYQPNLFSPFGH
jgi:hypothetical protein